MTSRMFINKFIFKIINFLNIKTRLFINKDAGGKLN